MTREQLQSILQELHENRHYSFHKTNLYFFINKYRNTSRDKTFNLHDEILEYSGKEKLPNRFIYGLLHEIALELQKDPNCSDQLYDLLTNYLDGLEKHPL